VVVDVDVDLDLCRGELELDITIYGDVREWDSIYLDCAVDAPRDLNRQRERGTHVQR